MCIEATKQQMQRYNLLYVSSSIRRKQSPIPTRTSASIVSIHVELIFIYKFPRDDHGGELYYQELQELIYHNPKYRQPIPNNLQAKMSSGSITINPTAFAEAIQELPLSAVYSKVAELRNSIAHLHRSNTELRLFLSESEDPEEEKKELEGYVTENEGVIASMNQRVELLKTELENRGQPWVEVDVEKGENDNDNGQEQTADGSMANGNAHGTGGVGEDQATANAGQPQDEDGVYL